MLHGRSLLCSRLEFHYEQEQDPKGIVGLKRIIMKQGKENEFESLFMDLMTRVRKHEKEVQLCSLQIRTI